MYGKISKKCSITERYKSYGFSIMTLLRDMYVRLLHPLRVPRLECIQYLFFDLIYAVSLKRFDSFAKLIGASAVGTQPRGSRRK